MRPPTAAIAYLVICLYVFGESSPGLLVGVHREVLIQFKSDGHIPDITYTFQGVFISNPSASCPNPRPANLTRLVFLIYTARFTYNTSIFTYNT
jgi:hypothetical protein